MPAPAASGVDALVEDYLAHLRVERGASAHTLSGYARDLRRYRDFLARRGIDEIAAIGPDLPADFAADLRAGRRSADEPEVWEHQPLADASIARAVVAVRGLHRFALAEGVSTADPAAAARPPRAPRRLPKALSVAEVQRLLAAPDPESPTGLRDRALLEVLYGTGARISEATGLDVDEVTPALDPDNGPAALRLFGKGSKERIVPFGSYARAAVAGYLVRARPGLATRGRGTPALFLNTRGARLSRQSAWAVLQDAAAVAGITAHVSPHTLRHSYATHLLDGGADVRVVQELLGHASVTTTQIYTLVTIDHLREVYLSAHPRAR